MVYIQTLLILLFPCVLLGQNWYLPSETFVKSIGTDDLADSILVFQLPSYCILLGVTLRVDSTVSSDDSVKIGISGELDENISPYRFGDIDTDLMVVGDQELFVLSHFNTRQSVMGGQYTHETNGVGDQVTVLCVNADTPYPMMGLRSQPRQDFDTTLSMSSSTVRFYQDGDYDVYFTASFSASGANRDIHMYLEKNGTKLNNMAKQRTIGTGGDIGDGTMMGNVSLSPGDSLSISVESSAANTTVAIQHASLTIEKDQDGLPYTTGATPRDIYIYTGATSGKFRLFIQYRRYL